MGAARMRRVLRSRKAHRCRSGGYETYISAGRRHWREAVGLVKRGSGGVFRPATQLQILNRIIHISTRTPARIRARKCGNRHADVLSISPQQLRQAWVQIRKHPSPGASRWCRLKVALIKRVRPRYCPCDMIDTMGLAIAAEHPR